MNHCNEQLHGRWGFGRLRGKARPGKARRSKARPDLPGAFSRDDAVELGPRFLDLPAPRTAGIPQHKNVIGSAQRR